MKYKTTLFILSLALRSQAIAAPTIIVGQGVNPGDWIARSVVALVATNSRSQALCTASIVAEDLAITAGHCISDLGSSIGKDAVKPNFTLFFGAEIRHLDAAHIREVDAVEIPKDWKPSSHKKQNTSDVALVHFSGGLPDGYQAADLMPFDRILTKGEDIELAGYGISNATADTGAGVLRKVLVNMKDPDFSSTEVELDQSHGGGACHGDSGGPAFLMIKGYPYLFGITSRGSGACDETVIYTRISAFSEWFAEASANLRK